MKAVTWQGKRNVSVENVPDPTIQEPTDAIIRVTSTAICGSDLHLYEVLGPFMNKGDVLGHEPMGIVEEVGAGVTNLKVGDRVVVPFNISCGYCFMCKRGLQSQCETTQVHSAGSGCAIYGYSELYGSVPGGQAAFLRVPFADYGPVKVGSELPDERYLYLSDILPTAWQGVQYADVPEGGVLAVYGLGPVGQFAARIGKYLGHRVIGVEPVAERREMAKRHGVETIDFSKDTAEELRSMTGGRGPDSIVDAAGMEAHGSPVGAFAQHAVGILPDKLAQKVMETGGTDRLSALHSAIDAVRRGGTVSLSGVYGGTASPMPLLTMFDKQLQFRMGQCNVRRWTDELLPIVEEPSDPLGVTDLMTHEVSIDEAPAAYKNFQKKTDGTIKVVLKPQGLTV
ncbi:glutathione-dependent formaldehyde dehydrogenase [Arthrobacter agilis]|uniref:zinc-dependent alcohol dehydrogenase n=1 Tax=Arthrobacter agilis TaxID=37921 RepID=UPI000B36162D|nr:zinc-dependent alcohol dehydrogenase [Arthrobacter agilis]OUM42419.1 glutathione-dependent formaldehyde dehydrogenase [Arthrobacter agilis]PPB45760.1 glutathione-dependent formaldehyde dehydrogenase [Arthrobacter agilis]TPV26257.1 glutathione-dependent formaldehyde dehydrogenase [Arthrobacter agilis]VDR30895.1 Formaldehyde dismutase [Arthrobacter agilis]